MLRIWRRSHLICGNLTATATVKEERSSQECSDYGFAARKYEVPVVPFFSFFNLPFQLFLIVGGFMPIHRFFSPRHDGQILGVIRAATITVLWHTYIGKII